MTKFTRVKHLIANATVGLDHPIVPSQCSDHLIAQSRKSTRVNSLLNLRSVHTQPFPSQAFLGDERRAPSGLPSSDDIEAGNPIFGSANLQRSYRSSSLLVGR